MRYIDKIEALPSTDANNALIIGIAMHTGIEKVLKKQLRLITTAFQL